MAEAEAQGARAKLFALAAALGAAGEPGARCAACSLVGAVVDRDGLPQRPRLGQSGRRPRLRDHQAAAAGARDAAEKPSSRQLARLAWGFGRARRW